TGLVRATQGAWLRLIAHRAGSLNLAPAAHRKVPSHYVSNFGAGTLESLIGDARPESAGCGRPRRLFVSQRKPIGRKIPPNTAAFPTNSATTPRTRGDRDRVAGLPGCVSNHVYGADAGVPTTS